LPEAHVEASTPGSVILAGILLKLGSYAFIKFILPFKYYVVNDLIFIIITISLIGFLYASIFAIIQIDIKKIIAYSSIAHMNFSLIGIFGSTIIGFIGAFTLMLGHAFTSTGLFIGMGILYDRYKTRIIFYYSGLFAIMPIFSFAYFIFIISNFNFPGTINFLADFLLLLEIMNTSIIFLFMNFFGLLISLLYSLSSYNRIFYGILQNNIKYFMDCTRLESYILIFPILFILSCG